MAVGELVDVGANVGRGVGVDVNRGVALTGGESVSGVRLSVVFREPLQAVNTSNNNRKNFLIFLHFL